MGLYYIHPFDERILHDLLAHASVNVNHDGQVSTGNNDDARVSNDNGISDHSTSFEEAAGANQFSQRRRIEDTCAPIILRAPISTSEAASNRADRPRDTVAETSLAASLPLPSSTSSVSQPRFVIPGTTFTSIPSRRDDGSVSFEERRTFAPWNVKNLIFDYESPELRRLPKPRKRSKSTAMSGFPAQDGASVDHRVLLNNFLQIAETELHIGVYYFPLPLTSLSPLLRCYFKGRGGAVAAVLLLQGRCRVWSMCWRSGAAAPESGVR